MMVVVYFALPVSVQNFTYDGFGLACVERSPSACAATGRAGRGPGSCSAAGVLLFVAGDTVLFYYQLSSGTQPFPSLADGLYLIGYAVRRRPIRRSRSPIR